MNEVKPEIPGFELIECCGRGATASVWWAIDADGFRRAIRIIDKIGVGPEIIAHERTSIAEYRNAARHHQNLIEILYLGQTEKYLYYVMPLADSAFPAQCRYTPMTLAIKLKRSVLSAPEIIDLFDTILTAVGTLHRNGLSHHDLKLENIIFVDGVLKIADPGLVMENDAISHAGSPEYQSDLMLDGTRCDIYALGKILYSMYSRMPVERFPELPRDFTFADPFFDFNAIALKCCSRHKQYNSIDAIQSDWDRCRKILARDAIKRKLWKSVAALVIIGAAIALGAQLLRGKLPELKAISIQIYVVGGEHYTGTR